MESSDASRLALIMGASVMINTVYSVQKGKDVVVPVVAGGITFVGLALFGGLTNRYSLSNAIAMVFLIASLTFRGLPLIQKSNLLGTSAGGKATKTNPQGTPGEPNTTPPVVNGIPGRSTGNAIN